MTKIEAPYEIFCAAEQKVTSWTHLPDRNGEVLFQCTECGRFLKYPAGISRGKLMKMFVDHERVNTGDVVVDPIQDAPLLVSQTPPPRIERWWERVLDRF